MPKEPSWKRAMKGTDSKVKKKKICSKIQDLKKKLTKGKHLLARHPHPTYASL
jgi:hypothetical protein